jgi:hypothetical protein
MDRYGTSGRGVSKVRYRFKDESKFVSVRVSKSQYQNLLDLPIIEECNIIR